MQLATIINMYHGAQVVQWLEHILDLKYFNDPRQKIACVTAALIEILIHIHYEVRCPHSK